MKLGLLAIPFLIVGVAAAQPAQNPARDFETALSTVCAPFIEGETETAWLSASNPTITRYAESPTGGVHYRVGAAVQVFVDGSIDRRQCSIIVRSGDRQRLSGTLEHRLARYAAAPTPQTVPFARLDFRCAPAGAPHDSVLITHFREAPEMPALAMTMERRAFRNTRCDGHAPQLKQRFEAAARACHDIIGGADPDMAARARAFLLSPAMPVATASFDDRLAELFGGESELRLAIDLDFNGDGGLFQDPPPGTGWVAIYATPTGDRCMVDASGGNNFQGGFRAAMGDLEWRETSSGAMRGPAGELTFSTATEGEMASFEARYVRHPGAAH